MKSSDPNASHVLISFGQLMHRIEFRMNKFIVSPDPMSPSKLLKKDNSDRYCKPLLNEAAFNKGVNYFSELVFLYGVLLMLAVYELKKQYKASLAAS